MATFYQRTTLSGGSADALDFIDGTDLVDADFAFVMTSAKYFYVYILDADSALDEDVPDVIKPDANAGNKRWIRQEAYLSAPSASPSLSPSTSPSLSPSTSPSLSPSASRSPSNSPSLSPSVSPSVSPSASPSTP